ncbi:MAG: FMN-dependent NADH-azoreductase [Gammaproteobacteria bacterium]
MTTILKINSSIYGDAGQSTALGNQFVSALLEREPDARVIERDVGTDPLPHLDAARFGAFLAKPEERTAEQAAVAETSDTLIAELRAADVLVLGVPMYNFSIPTQLKAWFDHIARAGVTFRYTDTGPVGLMTGKKAVVFATRGGAYAGSVNDTQTPYLRQFLGFLGIADVEFVYAEGLAMGPQARDNGLAQARAALQNLAPPARLAA